MNHKKEWEWLILYQNPQNGLLIDLLCFFIKYLLVLIFKFRRMHRISPSGEIGIHDGFKIRFLREWRFKSALGHQIQEKP